MHGIISGKDQTAISTAADSCHRQHATDASHAQRQHLAEPLWFALMCRALWPENAPKELQFILANSARPSLGRSDRTARAWATGESEPPVSVLLALLLSDHGWRVLEYLLGATVLGWWTRLTRALRIADQVDRLDLE